MNQVQNNKKIARLFLEECVARKNYEKLKEIIHEGYYLLDRIQLSYTKQLFDETTRKTRGIEGIIKRIETLHQFSSNFKFDILDVVGEDNNVIICYIFTFKFSGEYLGFPPTGQEVTNLGYHNFKFKDGKIIWIDFLMDNFKFLRDTGLTIINENDKMQVEKYMKTLMKLNIIPVH